MYNYIYIYIIYIQYHNRSSTNTGIFHQRLPAARVPESGIFHMKRSVDSATFYGHFDWTLMISLAFWDTYKVMHQKIGEFWKTPKKT